MYHYTSTKLVVLHSGITFPLCCEIWSIKLVSLTSDHLHTQMDAQPLFSKPLSFRPTECYYHGQLKAINVTPKWIMGHLSWGLVVRSCDGERWRSSLSPMRRPENCRRQTTRVWRHTFHVWQLGLTRGMSGCPLCPAQSISVPEWRNWPKEFGSPRTPLHVMS